MIKRLSILSALLVAASCRPDRAESKPRDPGTVQQVEIYVGGASHPAPKYEVKSFHSANGTGSELAPRFRGLTLSADLKPGDYEYLLQPVDTVAYPPAEYSLSGRVLLRGPEAWITLKMPADPVGADFGETFIYGSIQPVPEVGNSPLWVRLQNVVAAGEIRQAKARPDGSFRIEVGRLTGNFVVTVCRGDDVLYLNTVRFVNSHPDHLDIRLPPRPPAPH